ncbi:hypothetical protein GGX14DRAFT_397544 [Mycena pura]|uniref:Uncharacterized protein n=1 Tax=Mycena pura TaxID=153505 RepID=A0AAD6YAB8_9AGAR|nr:hypothetical protein GGX14DRAFT_397544 [Mycena pura]
MRATHEWRRAGKRLAFLRSALEPASDDSRAHPIQGQMESRGRTENEWRQDDVIDATGEDGQAGRLGEKNMHGSLSCSSLQTFQAFGEHGRVGNVTVADRADPAKRVQDVSLVVALGPQEGRTRVPGTALLRCCVVRQAAAAVLNAFCERPEMGQGIFRRRLRVPRMSRFRSAEIAYRRRQKIRRNGSIVFAMERCGLPHVHLAGKISALVPRKAPSQPAKKPGRRAGQAQNALFTDDSCTRAGRFEKHEDGPRDYCRSDVRRDGPGRSARTRAEKAQALSTRGWSVYGVDRETINKVIGRQTTGGVRQTTGGVRAAGGYGSGQQVSSSERGRERRAAGRAGWQAETWRGT